MFFDYELPPGLIAQHPAPARDGSRLLVVCPDTGTLAHRHFRDLPEYLRPGDLLVRNETEVLAARLIGTRDRTGGKWEGLALAERPSGEWELLAQTRGTVEVGETLTTETGLTLTLTGRADGHWLMRPAVAGAMPELLRRYGTPPLPPYIRKGRAGAGDAERYQTVYAARPGSVAAPTAGLHFTPELFAELAEQGVRTAAVTLHVGLGTFAPVKAADPRDHRLHPEYCEVPATTVQAVRATKAARGRVFAVGTTTTRTLETAARHLAAHPGATDFRGESALYVHPPFAFEWVDGLITNFHLPRTTLLLLVQALAGVELTRRAYAAAVAEGYRFFSYGDAMLVLPRAGK